MADPAYSRMNVEDRRRQLLELGADLFARHSYDELSMAAIAREAGISKALLYHYFPSKADYFQATVAAAAEELGDLTTPDPDLPPIEALAASLDAFLAWIDANAVAYTKLMQGATGAAEVRDLVAGVRDATARQLLEAIDDDRPAVRVAVRGWLGYMDAACLDWVEHRDMSREEVRNLLLGSLGGALMAAGAKLPG